MIPPWTPSAAVVLLGALATCWDMRLRVVPNRLNLAGVVVGLALGAARGGVHGVLWAGLGMALGVAAFAGPWLAGGLGGGDLKLAAAIGAIVAWPLALPTLLLAAVAMALWSLGWAAWMRLTGTIRDTAALRALRVPQAPAIAAGAAVATVLALVR